MKAKRLNIRLFLEGIEVPVVSAVVTSIPDSPLQCSIQVPPLDEVHGLIERTLVHLFFYDPQSEDETDWDIWKLLFVGEITGFQFQKTGSNRALVLQCLGLSSYWDTTYLFNATGLGKKGKRLANFVGANTAVASGSTNIFGENTTGYDKISKLIMSKPASFRQMKGLMAGIVHVLEQIGGFYRGEKVFKGYNDFTSLAELRLKLMQQVHAANNDNSSAKLFKRPTLRKWVKNSIASRGSMESFNGVIKKLMQLIYHSRQSIPAPPYFPGKETKKKKTYYTARSLGADKLVAKIESHLKKMDSAADAFLAQSAQSVGAKNPKFLILVRAEHQYRSLAKACREEANSAKRRGRGGDAPKFLRAAKYLDKAASVSDRMEYAYPPNLLANPGYVRRPANHAERAKGILKSKSRQKKSKIITEIDYERLGIHVFKPDIFFTSPPCCNVLFPELYKSFEWSRNYLAEPTRFMLRGGGGRKGDIFGGGYSKYGVYFAPDIPSVRRNVKLSSKKFASEILPHEIYSGIIPAQGQIPWAKVYKIDIKGAKKYPYIQRIANFEYFKQHFGSRNASLTGPFNPYFLPGFPALVVDRPLTLYQLSLYQLPLKEAERGLEIGENDNFKTRADLLEYLTSTQYLGQCMQLTHSLNQTSGLTNYNLLMVRGHRETGNKLGIDTKETYTRYRSSTQSSIVLLPASFKGAKFSKWFRRGPHGHKVISGRPLSSSVLRKPGKVFWYPIGDITNLLSGSRFIGSWGRKRWTASDALLYRTRETAFQSQEYRAFRLIEQRSVAAGKVTRQIPLEHALTPPWLARVWHPTEIGNTYDAMFGCQSIADEIGVFADSQIAAAYRHDRSLRDTTQKQLAANPYDDDLPVTNKDTDTLDYSAYDDDDPTGAGAYRD